MLNPSPRFSLSIPNSHLYAIPAKWQDTVDHYLFLNVCLFLLYSFFCLKKLCLNFILSICEKSLFVAIATLDALSIGVLCSFSHLYRDKVNGKCVKWWGVSSWVALEAWTKMTKNMTWWTWPTSWLKLNPQWKRNALAELYSWSSSSASCLLRSLDWLFPVHILLSRVYSTQHPPGDEYHTLKALCVCVEEAHWLYYIQDEWVRSFLM